MGIIVQILAVFFTAVAMLGLVFTLFGEGFWYFELAAYAVPLYPWLAGLSSIAFLLLKRPRAAALAALVSAVAGVVMAWPGWLSTAPSPVADGSESLRILSANVWFDNDNPDRLLSLIEATQPDLVLIQEYTEAWSELLKPLETEYPYHLGSKRYEKGNLDLAVYWKQPGLHVRPMHGDGLPAIGVEVWIGGVPCRVLNVHTAAAFSPRRSSEHGEQMLALSRWVQGSDRPVIIAGDLNSTPWSPSLRRLLAETGLRSAREGRGVMGTWPSLLGPISTPLDHVLVAPGLAISEFGVGPSIGSDHRPLQFDIGLARR